MKNLSPARLKSLAILLPIIAGLTAAIISTPVGAAPVQDGPIFNLPNSNNEGEEYAIINRIIDLIHQAPAGSTIKMSFYSLTIPFFADEIVAQHEDPTRKINFRIIMSEHGAAQNQPWAKLTASLGTDASQKSFAITCKGGCMTAQPRSYVHAKMFLFPRTAGKNRVSVVSSTNPTKYQARVGFNDAYIMTDAAMYNFYDKYFDDMVAGYEGMRWTSKNGSPSNYYRTRLSGSYKSYLFPRSKQPKQTKNSSDTVYGILSNIQCSGATNGHGRNGNTVVRLAIHGWTKGRISLAEKLWEMDNAGCEVEVVYCSVFDERTGTTVTEPEILAVLKNKNGVKNGGIKTYDLTIDNDGDGDIDIYTHSKYMLIDGAYAGNKSSRYVFTGSHNFTNNGLRYNNEIMLRVKNESAYQQYAANFETQRSLAKPDPQTPTSTKKSTKPPLRAAHIEEDEPITD